MTSLKQSVEKPSRPTKRENDDSSSGDEAIEEFVDGIMLKFENGDHVLSRWRDGQGFLADVERVDVSERRLHLKYEDGTRFWADVKDVRMDAASWDVTSCSQCLLRKSELRHLPAAEREAIEESKCKEQLFRCYDCGWYYHESCHMPRLSPEYLSLHGGPSKFICRTCVFMHVAKTVKDEKDRLVKEKKPSEKLRESMLVKRDMMFQQYSIWFNVFEQSKRHLPYSLDSLMWREQHASNEQNCYCYCGGPCKWHDQMFQCGTCRQWFHENCVRASVVISCRNAGREPCTVPDLENHHYDTWFSYTCACCSPDGFDSIVRYPITWHDLIVICMLNVTEGKAKVSIKNIVLPWLKERSKNFILAEDEAKMPTNDAEWMDLVINVIKASPARFHSTFTSMPAKSSSPTPSVGSVLDPWCQLKSRHMNPRRLPEIKSNAGNSAAQRNMRVRMKKSLLGDLSEDPTQEDQQSTVTTSTNSVNPGPQKKGRPSKVSERDAATQKILAKMAGVAHLMTTGYNPFQNNRDIPDLNSAPFFRLMPSLHSAPSSRPLSVQIPTHDSYFNLGKGELALVQPLRYDPLTGASISPAVSSNASAVSPSPSQLVGAKKRKAYRPFHSASTSSNSRQSTNSGGSDGVSSIASISPIAMMIG